MGFIISQRIESIRQIYNEKHCGNLLRFANWSVVRWGEVRWIEQTMPVLQTRANISFNNSLLSLVKEFFFQQQISFYIIVLYYQNQLIETFVV